MTQEQTQQPNNKWPKHRLTFNDNLIEDIEIHLIPSLESLKEVKTIPLHNSKIEIIIIHMNQSILEEIKMTQT